MVITISGFDVRVGREARPRGREDDLLRRAAAPAVASFQTPERLRHASSSALSVASVLPDASGAGDVSMPSPVVIWTRRAARHGTAQMCRRSMSFAFVQ